MKKTLSLIFMALLLCATTVFTFTGCNRSKKYCEHTYDNACDTICNECKETRELTTPHIYDDCADTECNECGNKRDSMHTWNDATCLTPKTCNVCGATDGAALGHTWVDANFYTPKTCTVCGKIEGYPHASIPNVFEQVNSDDDSVVAEYKYKLAETVIENGVETVVYKDVPARFTLRVENKANEDIILKSVKLRLVDNDGVVYPLASSEVSVQNNGEEIDLVYSGEYNEICVKVGDKLLAPGETFIAYAVALPLSDDSAFEGKQIEIVIETSTHEFPSFALDTKILVNANPNNECNLAEGKLYTFRVGTVCFQNCISWKDGVCEACGKICDHQENEDDGDCTTEIICSACGTTVTPAKDSHTGGTATCVSGKICDFCETEYGDVDPTNHASDVYNYTDNGDGTHTKVHECGVTLDNAETHSYDMNTGECECGTFVVAKVGEAYYKTFEEAVAAWTDGTTLILLSDAAATKEILISGKSVTFDMNGHTYYGRYCLFTVKEGASLVIIDSSSEGDGLLKYTGSGNYAIFVKGNLTFAGGKVTSSAQYNSTVYISAGAFKMTGGTVENTVTCPIDLNSSAIGTISGGTILSGSCGIESFGTLNISGSPTFHCENGCSVEIWDGFIDLSEVDITVADGWTISNGIYGALRVGSNLLLPDKMELQVDTIAVTVLELGYTGVISHPHVGGTATCGAQAICDICAKPYGATPEHSFDEAGTCYGCAQQAIISVTDGANTYYALDPISLNQAVTNLLNSGERTFTVNLPANAEAKLFTAIRRALIDTEGVRDGTVHLTLAGVTVIPYHDEFNPATAIFGEILGDEIEAVTQIASITLPDVLTIGNGAFNGCEKLTSLFAPKVQRVGEKAFASTNLFAVELPEATTLEYAAFYNCQSLTTIKLPKVTALGQQALDTVEPSSELTIYLTANGEITVDEDLLYILIHRGHLSTKVNLVLNCANANKVSGTTWTTKDVNDKECSFTFKTITLQHDGELVYTDNDDGTHNKVCSACSNEEDENTTM